MKRPLNENIINIINDYQIYCTFIDNNDNTYEVLSNNIVKLTKDYIELNMVVGDNGMVIFTDLFNLLKNNVTMVVNYENFNVVNVAEFWFKRFKIKNIEDIFTFDYNSGITIDTNTNLPTSTLKTFKLYYDYESIEFMQTDDSAIRKSKLNKLMNIDGDRNIIDKNMII